MLNLVSLYCATNYVPQTSFPPMPFVVFRMLSSLLFRTKLPLGPLPKSPTRGHIISSLLTTTHNFLSEFWDCLDVKNDSV